MPINDDGLLSDKNKKALGLTALTCILLVLMFVLVSWTNTITKPAASLDDGGVEVNFGNSDQGLGDVPPMIPDDPAPEAKEQQQEAPPASSPSQDQEEESYKDVAENNDADAPVIKTEPKPKKVIQPTEHKVITPKKENKVETPPTPTPKKTMPTPSVAKAVEKPTAPKAVYKGGNGKGGNGADSYNGVKSQGIVGGHGDQGKMTGDPNSDSYNGTGKGKGGSGSGSGSSGVQVISGLNGRRFAGFPSFEDSFNENARVSVDIAVDENGSVISASINPRGTTTTDSNIRSIALRRARQLKFSKGNVEKQTGTVSFNFRLKG